MNEWQIGLLGTLEENESKEQINKDIESVQKYLNSIDIKAKLNKDDLDLINNQLNNLKVTLTNVTIDQKAIDGLISDINSALSKVSFNVNVNENINSGSDGKNNNNGPSNNNVRKKQSHAPITNYQTLRQKVGYDFSESFDNTTKAAKEAQKEFRDLLKNENSVVTVLENFDDSKLTSFVVNVQRATGEVEKFNYQLRNLGDNDNPIEKFKFTGATINDLPQEKLSSNIDKVIADYTAKLSQFKSTNSEILSGLSGLLEDFEDKLTGLKNGSSTIDDVVNSFKYLNSEASNITANFKRQLSPIDSAITKIEKGEESIKGLRAEFKGLQNAPSEISKELNECTKSLQRVKDIESKEGRTSNWAEEYRKWSDSIDILTAKLATLKKEQSNLVSSQPKKISELKNNNIPYMSKVYNSIEKQIPEIERMARGQQWNILDVKGIEDTSGKIGQITLRIQELDGSIKELTMQREKLEGKSRNYDGIVQVGDIRVIQTATEAQRELNDEISKSLGPMGNVSTSISTLQNNYMKLGLSSSEIDDKLSNVNNDISTLFSLINKGANFSEIQSQFERVKFSLKESQNEFKQTRSDLGLLVSDQRRLAKANEIEAWNQKNTRATRSVREENEKYIQTLRNLDQQMTKMDFDSLNLSFKRNENSMRTLNRLGASLKDQFAQAASSFTQWVSVSSLIMGTVYQTQKAVGEIKELDNTLTEISKTSDLTKNELKELGLTAYDVASDYGRTASDYLSGVQNMSQSGFYGEQGSAMAEQSLLAQSAGDMTQELADKYVLATNAAYKYNGEASKINEVIDGQNSITNRNSVALEDMALAMTEAGTVAANYRVNIQDLSAMIGTMESVTKSGGAEIGNAAKSILINLQNINSNKIVDTLAAAKAPMTEFVNGVEKLRNPITIIRDLSKTFNELDEDDPLRAEILTNIGGKYQANKLSAILSNMEMFDKMLVDYSEGSGSAFEESSKSANNLQGRLNALSNSITELVNTFINSDGLTAAVRVLDNLVQGTTKLVDTVSPLTIGFSALGGILGSKGFGLKVYFYKYQSYKPIYIRLCNNAT